MEENMSKKKQPLTELLLLKKQVQLLAKCNDELVANQTYRAELGEQIRENAKTIYDITSYLVSLEASSNWCNV